MILYDGFVSLKYPYGASDPALIRTYANVIECWCIAGCENRC
jgi:hypothetical protein